MASLPIGAAGRATLGLGKRLTGRPADEVKLEFQQRTAEQLFRVLGDLKGGAMKLGQALSVFEAAMPEALAAPYRDALTRLQQDAPPLPAATVHKVLASQLGPHWRRISGRSTTSRRPQRRLVRSIGQCGLTAVQSP